jgi:CubicO group peptidase (beta-lactamase class C family)
MRAVLALALGVSVSGWSLVGAAQTSAYPAAHWDRIPNPAAAGYSLARLDGLRETLRAGQTTGMLITVGGRVLFEYGDVAETSYVASVRKSLVSMLYGKYVANGTVRLHKTLGELGMDDTRGLLPIEREATVGDLLKARSGVYHPAANLGDASDRAPARGSVRPGSYFLYNNWDFNALGWILEHETRRSIYDLFTDDIARPIGLQDWNPTPGAHAPLIRNDTKLSRYPAHHFVLSTRDMARVGYLMLRQGRWEGRQVVPADWVARTTATATPAQEVERTSPFIAGLGYGYLWWVFDPVHPSTGSPLSGAFTASGAYGQYITVVPGLDLVIGHKTAVPPPRNVTNERYFGTILPQAIAAGRSGG